MDTTGGFFPGSPGLPSLLIFLGKNLLDFPLCYIAFLKVSAGDTGRVLMNSTSACLAQSSCLSPSVLKDNTTGYGDPDWLLLKG